MRVTHSVATRLLLFLLMSGSSLAIAQDQASASQSRPTGREISYRGRKIILPDASLVDQDGRRVRLYEDLIKGRTVALGFFYTRCTFVCTRHGQLFSDLQAELGSRLGKDVFLISLNMDPQFDTPERIAAWGRAYGRRPGWTLLTGSLNEVARVLIALTADGPGPRESHGNFFYVANDRTGVWDAMFVQMPPGEVAKRLTQLGSAPELLP